LALPLQALAHQQGTIGSSALLTGLSHPISGIDHVLAMLAVGMWGARLGMPAIWLLPVTFPLMMTLGGIAGMLGLPLPGVELGIGLSVVVLGGVILAGLRAPLWVSMPLVGVFAVFHGYAHGVEMPSQGDPLAYSLGFVVATGLIHIAGIAIGLVTRLPHGHTLLRIGGGCITAAGIYLLMRT
jgi:urease accessory protein